MPRNQAERSKLSRRECFDDCSDCEPGCDDAQGSEAAVEVRIRQQLLVEGGQLDRDRNKRPDDRASGKNGARSQTRASSSRLTATPAARPSIRLSAAPIKCSTQAAPCEPAANWPSGRKLFRAICRAKKPAAGTVTTAVAQWKRSSRRLSITPVQNSQSKIATSGPNAPEQN